MRIAIATLALCVGACASTVPATGTVVELDADPGIRADARELVVVVQGTSASGVRSQPREETIALAEHGWPIRVTIAPDGGDATRTFSLEVVAHDTSGAAIATVRASSGFIARRTLFVHLVLEDCCRGATCSDDETCTSCGCAAAALDPVHLRDFDPSARADGGVVDGAASDGAIVDGGTSDDGGHDAALAPDAGPECTTNDDCTGARSVCNALGHCVACTTEDDVCPSGQSCDGATERCVSRCDGDAECVIPGALHQSATCASGACSYVCDEGWDDCNDLASDGCEASLDSLADCGACHAACAIASGTGVCVDRTCTIASCNTGRADCDGSLSTGCETDTTNDPAHCGVCTTSCAAASATTACIASTCTIVTCDPGRGDCDGSLATGCETDTASTFTSCGSCGRSCALRGTSRECRASACETLGCLAGYTDCSAAVEGCEAYLANDRNNCGSCGHVCGAGEGCSNGGCCPLGYDYCPGVGCVNEASDRNHCGSCTTVCGGALRCFDYECVP
jgi:hypothetical protein